MKFGMRKRSFKKSFKAKTTGKIKRKVKKATNPFYGKKGVGFIKNPKKAVYNKIYRKTTFDRRKLYKITKSKKSSKKATKSAGSFLYSLLILCLVLLAISAFIAFLVPALCINVCVMAIYFIIKWYKDSHRYSEEQVQRLSTIIPDEMINNKKIKSATFAKIVPQYINSLSESVFSATISMQTANVDDFFHLYSQWENDTRILDLLIAIDSEPEEYISTKDSEANSIQVNMITRTFQEEIDSASSLKTDKGKKNRYIKYFEKFDSYSDLLLPDSRVKINELKAEHLNP